LGDGWNWGAVTGRCFDFYILQTVSVVGENRKLVFSYFLDYTWGVIHI
jgi:hypothetical protein